jgi:serine phosphatase RsbU (regulator of sigma subunit)
VIEADAPWLLLVEDDDQDAMLFRELVASELHLPLQLEVVSSLGDAVECIERRTVAVCVLDLGLPGCSGLQALEELRAHHPEVPTVVLTGRVDRDLGLSALSLGAQDYLVKGADSAATTARSIRYAIERASAERTAAELAVARARAVDQARLETSLLATPQLRAPQLTWVGRYVVARAGAVGGDFMDCVQVDDSVVRMVVGDVAGHGPDEAALGVALRAAWRTLALNSAPDADLLPGLERMMRAERPSEHDFATMADLRIHLGDQSLTIRSAGHPPVHLSGVGLVADRSPRPPLGLAAQFQPSPGTEHHYTGTATVTLFTDGLYETRRCSGEVGDVEDLEHVFDPHHSRKSIDQVLDAAQALATETWRDDVAIGQLWINA